MPWRGKKEFNWILSFPHLEPGKAAKQTMKRVSDTTISSNTKNKNKKSKKKKKEEEEEEESKIPVQQ